HLRRAVRLADSVDERRHGTGVGHVDGGGGGLTTRLTDRADEVVEPVRATGAHDHGVAGGGQCLGGGPADPGRGPRDEGGPVRRARQRRVLQAHDRLAIRIGRCANPPTSEECTRSAPGRSSPALLEGADMASAPRLSSRARWAPRQKWGPWPKLRLDEVSRLMSLVSPSVNTCPSRLAEPMSMRTF